MASRELHAVVLSGMWEGMGSISGWVIPKTRNDTWCFLAKCSAFKGKTKEIWLFFPLLTVKYHWMGYSDYQSACNIAFGSGSTKSATSRHCQDMTEIMLKVSLKLHYTRASRENLTCCDSTIVHVLNYIVFRISASVWNPSNLQADAAFIIEIGCTSKVLEGFKNDRIIVKTGPA